MVEGVESVDCIVIGAGVIGLAVARALALRGYETIILESEGAIGTGVSSRNSEVIHAGIYYREQSLMARLCREGRAALYAFCEENDVPHRRCGKLVVATSAEDRSKLAGIARRAAGNGVDDIVELTRSEAIALEPALECEGALLSPSTGIVDSHAYMSRLRSDAEARGAAVAFRTPFVRAERRNLFHVRTGGKEPVVLACRALVNAAGLSAPAVARSIEDMPSGLTPTPYFAKGSYFTLNARAPFSRLIYPAPVRGGLGIHLTLDLSGRARFGPDVEWVDRPDYQVDPARAECFAKAISRYWPSIEASALRPDYAGIRPKIVPPEVATQDFEIQTRTTHGLKGLVNLFGIESPGLTASLALADEVAQFVSADIGA